MKKAMYWLQLVETAESGSGIPELERRLLSAEAVRVRWSILPAFVRLSFGSLRCTFLVTLL